MAAEQEMAAEQVTGTEERWRAHQLLAYRVNEVLGAVPALLAPPAQKVLLVPTVLTAATVLTVPPVALEQMVLLVLTVLTVPPVAADQLVRQAKMDRAL